MPSFGEYFRSVEDVWAIGLGSFALLAFLTYRALRHVSWRHLKRVLWSEDDGASYVLPYMLTFPIYLMLMCLTIEASLILIVKFGTVNAAYAAARSAIVWRSFDPDEQNAPWSKAAVLAMAPFANSNTGQARRMYPEKYYLYFNQDRDWFYRQGYGAIENDNISKDRSRTAYFIKSPKGMVTTQYVNAKLKYAWMATTVEIKANPDGWNENVSATVHYEMPMHVPGAGRILGNPWAPSRFFARVITSTVTLPSETPQGNGTLGIGYDPRN